METEILHITNPNIARAQIELKGDEKEWRDLKEKKLLGTIKIEKNK